MIVDGRRQENKTGCVLPLGRRRAFLQDEGDADARMLILVAAKPQRPAYLRSGHYKMSWFLPFAKRCTMPAQK